MAVQPTADRPQYDENVVPSWQTFRERPLSAVIMMRAWSATCCGCRKPDSGYHAAGLYSWISPPRTSRRLMRSRAVTGLGSGSPASGGRWLRERWGRCAL
jgi:hypothetical protein